MPELTRMSDQVVAGSEMGRFFQGFHRFGVIELTKFGRQIQSEVFGNHKKRLGWYRSRGNPGEQNGSGIHV